MIVDLLSNSNRYASLHPSLPMVFSFLKRDMKQTSGRVELDGDNVFILFSQGQGKQESEVPLEAHRRYIDIHVCTAGVENIGWRATNDCGAPDKGYDEEKDFITFSDEPQSWATLVPGSFAIFFPEDAHAPMVSDGIVTKAVAKVKVV
jgi:biofilm protein TabA